jgi:hypothetical protein
VNLKSKVMFEVGDRIKLIDMRNDPDPIPSGTEGTVYYVGGDVINVQWDNGRTLGLIEGEDKFINITL